MNRIKPIIILLIPPLIVAFSTWVYCENTTFCHKFGSTPNSIGAFIYSFIVALIVYFIFKLLNLGIYKIFSKRIKSYQLALIVSIVFILILLSTPYFQMTKAYLTKNVSFCEQLSLADKSHCVSMIARFRNDKSICDTLPELEKSFCLNRFNEEKKAPEEVIEGGTKTLEEKTSGGTIEPKETECDIWRKECVKEGEGRCSPCGCRNCCSGLVSRESVHPYRNETTNEVVCLENMTAYVCVECGDGICGQGEDWCICPEDCEKPDPSDLMSTNRF